MALNNNFATNITAQITSLTAAERVGIADAVFVEAFELDRLSDFHTILTAVRTGNLIPIISKGSPYAGLQGADGTSCTFNVGALDTNYTSMKWDLAEYNERVAICMRTFTEDFLVFWGMYRQRAEAIDFDINSGSPSDQMGAFLIYLQEMIADRATGATWRTAWYGDKTYNSTNKELINKNNGIFTLAAAGTGTKFTIETVAATATGKELIEGIRAQIDAKGTEFFMMQDDLVIKMPYSTAWKIVVYLNSLKEMNPYDCACVSADGLTTKPSFSVDGLTISGIKVEAHRELDGARIAVYGASKDEILITRKSNILIGTNTEQSLESFDFFYDRVTKNIYMDTAIFVGGVLPLNEYIYIDTEISGN